MRTSGRCRRRDVWLAAHLDGHHEADERGEQRTSRAIWRATGRASVLIRTQDLVGDLGGLVRDQLVQRRVAHQLSVLLEDRRDLGLVVGRQDRARIGQRGEGDRQVASSDPPARQKAEGETKRSGGGSSRQPPR